LAGGDFMPRENRIILEGAIYHVYQRGNNREHIFGNPKHKAFLIKQIKEYNELYDFQLLAYVIMDNHYHLLIKTNKASISEIMFSINNVIGKYLNRELKRTGHIFESRFKSRLVEDKKYLIWLLRYIHRNPVRATLCETADEYRWSSHYFYKCGMNKIVNSDFILRIISPDKAEAIRQYRKLVGVKEDNDLKTDFEKIKHEFKFDDSKRQYEESQTITTRLKSLESIFDAMDLDVEIKELIKAGSKKRSLTVYKIKFFQEAIRNKHKLKEIGEFLNTTQPAISNILAYYKAEGTNNSNI
jgi:putative transposase